MAEAKVSHLQKTQKSDQRGNLIAAVLAHPDTPTDVYNGIVDGLAEIKCGQAGNQPEAIQATIDAAKERATGPKGDERNNQTATADSKQTDEDRAQTIYLIRCVLRRSWPMAR
ncbi:MAG: hypothetical protein L0387_12405 [Acidobacteria bacterium]|nr:hypothetical protein [Acidobacteriota bacterium]MCI0622442.1 hypothetical protein [Acidobacteriota bacterium]MCI0722360.1 hypothetical protein [Acidobacteriota bacterium]